MGSKDNNQMHYKDNNVINRTKESNKILNKTITNKEKRENKQNKQEKEKEYAKLPNNDHSRKY